MKQAPECNNSLMVDVPIEVTYTVQMQTQGHTVFMQPLSSKTFCTSHETSVLFVSFFQDLL